MKKQNFFKILFCCIVSSFLFAGCSYGIQFSDNCKSPETLTVAVLPFKNDNYNCDANIGRILENMCYQIVDGKTLVNEYCFSTGISLENVIIEDFVEFAKSRKIDKIVYGNVHIEWVEGRKVSQNRIAEASNEINDDYSINALIEGNYAIVNCDCIDTKSGQKLKVFDNYLVKKIPLGMPELPHKQAGL